MTTGLRTGREGDGPLLLTKLPGPGTVLVRAEEPPLTAAPSAVDVRPGPHAVFDGLRHHGTVHVRTDDGGEAFDTAALGSVGESVGRALDERGVDVVRFGDRASCHAVWPRATVVALERVLRRAAVGQGTTLVTWTSGAARRTDGAAYEVVIDGRVARGD